LTAVVKPIAWASSAMDEAIAGEHGAMAEPIARGT
jgi:hypothetical protein